MTRSPQRTDCAPASAGTRVSTSPTSTTSPGLRRRTLVRSGIAAAALAGLPWAAQAQQTPLKLVVPSAPGGSGDVVARLLAPHMSGTLGRPVVVENKPGASGTIAVRQAETSTPENPVFSLYATTTMMAFVLQGQEPALDRITPISQMFEQFTLFAVNPAVAGMAQVHTMQDFVAAAKRSGHPLPYASPAPGSISHLTTERMCNMAGIQLQHVAYKNGAPHALTDLLAGHLSMVALDMTTLSPHLNSGKLRAIGINYPKRLPQLPQVATLAEAGFPDLASVVAWVNLVGPARLPAEQVQTLNQAMRAAIADAANHKRMNELYALPKTGTPQEAKALMQRDLPYWRKVITDNRITV